MSKMKNPSIIFTIIFELIIIIYSAGCAVLEPAPTHVFHKAPTPLPVFEQLPKYGRIECSIYGMTSYDLNELPGLTPETCDSSCTSELGDVKGLASPCTIVLITNYSWSEWDNKYYLYAKYMEPIQVTYCTDGSGDVCNMTVEFQKSEGWIEAKFVEFPYSGPEPTPDIPYPTRKPVSMPKIPDTFQPLPQNGRIRCDLEQSSIDDPQFPDQHSPTTVFLWESPFPTIKQGNYGDGYPTIYKPVNSRKRVEFCGIVKVIDYTWSEWDGTFYFYVELVSYGYGGWIKQEYVEFPYVSPLSTPLPANTPRP